MLQDLRFSLRTLARHPSFACAAIAVMALGVGATTAVFSVLRGVLIAPLPYREPARLILFRATLPGIERSPELTSVEFHELRGRTDLFASVAAAVPAEGHLTVGDVMVPITAAAVSENLLDTLGVRLAAGRSVSRAAPGAHRPVVISDEVWQRHFQGDPGIVGRTIEVNGGPAAVAGVLPRGFRLYLGVGVPVASQLDLLTFRSSGYDDDPFRGNVVLARLQPGMAIETARAGVATTAAGLVARHPAAYRSGPVRLSIAPLEAEVVSEAKPAVAAVTGAVLLVLLTACANLGNLLLGRATARSHEMAIRASIGARRRDIVRQLLAEGIVLGMLGAAGGWMLAHWGIGGLLALAPAALPRRETIVLDGGVALFALALAFTCAVAVSLVPAWHATRADLLRRAGADRVPRGSTTRGLLVAAQLALSVVLLVGAGLLGRAFVNMRSVPLGFDPSGRAMMHVSLDGQRWGAGTIEDARVRRRGFYEQLTRDAAHLTGVHRVGVGFPVPLAGIAMSQRVSLGPAELQREADGFIAFAGYLETLGVPLIEGRFFTSADHGQAAVVVDDRLARDLWPGRSAVGQRLYVVKLVGGSQWATVVGVVAHVHARTPRAPGPPQVWMTYAVRAYAQLDLVVHASDPMDAAGQIAAAVQRLGAGRPVRGLRRLEDHVADASADTRFALFVLGLLAAAAVALAAVGVYGTVSYATARRRREIAVRLALGAQPRQVVARIVREGSRWTLAGLAFGLAGAGLLAGYLESLLFRVEARDGGTFTVVAAFLAAVTLAASALPAFRASRIDPARALRSE